MMKPVIVLLTLSVFAIAQDSDAPATFRGMVRMNRAPVSDEVLHVKLPRPVERKLSNGIELLVLERHRAPTISLTIARSNLAPSPPLGPVESHIPSRRAYKSGHDLPGPGR